MDVILILIWGFIFGIIGDVIAYYRSASIGKGFLAGFLLGPFGILLVFALPKVPQEGRTKKCPYCAEIIKEDAKVCKHCNKEFSQKNNKNYNNS